MGKAFNIKTVIEKLTDDYNEGKMSARQVAIELYKNGHTNYILSDEEAIEYLK